MRTRQTFGPAIAPATVTPGKRRRFKQILAAALLIPLTAAMSTACAKEEKPPSQWNTTIRTTPAPEGWLNSKDGAFRIQVPSAYLDAYDAVSGSKLPDAQMILSLPSENALNGYVPVLVIDHAKATSDPDVVESNLKEDPVYKGYKNFTVLNPTQVEGLNVLEMKWQYVFQEVEMTAFMTMVSGNNHAYALKQDVPDYALDTYQPIIDQVLKTWTWNEAIK